MSRFVACGVGVLAMIGSVSVPAAPLQSGVELKYVDHSVRPQDDLYRYLNGKWLDSFQLPADKGSYGSFAYVDDKTQDQLRELVDGLVQAETGQGTGGGTGGDPAGSGKADADVRKITDLYASFMDEARLDALGLE